MADNYIVMHHDSSVCILEIVFLPYTLKFFSHSCIPLISIDVVALNTPAQLIHGHTPSGYNDQRAKGDAPNFITVIICCREVTKLKTTKFISGGKFNNSQNLVPHYTVCHSPHISTRLWLQLSHVQCVHVDCYLKMHTTKLPHHFH